MNRARTAIKPFLLMTLVSLCAGCVDSDESDEGQDTKEKLLNDESSTKSETDTGSRETSDDSGAGITSTVDIAGADDPESCYSPENLTADNEAPFGCSCDREDASICISYLLPSGYAHLRALDCYNGHWTFVEDGACEPTASDCYGPQQNLVTAHKEGATGCPCEVDGVEVCAAYYTLEDNKIPHPVALACVAGHWSTADVALCTE